MIHFLNPDFVPSLLHFNHKPENLVLLTTHDERTAFLNEHCEAVEFKQINLLDTDDKGFFQAPLFNTELRYVSVEKNFGYALVNNWKKKELEVYRFGKDETWTNFHAKRAAMFAGR